jgi:hypothetical protein
MSSDYLDIYLNDHLAGATGGVELARRVRKSNAGEREFATSLGRLCEEIEADRATLEALIDGLGITRDRIKPVGAWVREKVARLKPNGQLRGYAPLSRVLELKGLAMGITGKKGPWEALRDRGLVAPPGVDFERLAIRAEEQRATIAGLHSLAAARL